MLREELQSLTNIDMLYVYEKETGWGTARPIK